jgi:hypothetical protein
MQRLRRRDGARPEPSRERLKSRAGSRQNRPQGGRFSRDMDARTRILLGLAIVSLAALASGVTYASWGHHPKTVLVPSLADSSSVPETFDRLRERGFRVAIPGTTRFYATTAPYVVLQRPRAGTRLPWGSVVRLKVVMGPVGSPSGPKDLPTYRVPSFVGKRLSDAIAWTHGKTLWWQSFLPPLAPSSARHLFDAYAVTAQHPRAGSYLRLWVRVGQGVHLTPLVLDVAQR